MELKENETLESLRLRMSEQCAIEISKYCKEIDKKGYLEDGESNNGENTFKWKDCTKKIQITASKNLKKLYKTNYA